MCSTAVPRAVGVSALPRCMQPLGGTGLLVPAQSVGRPAPGPPHRMYAAKGHPQGPQTAPAAVQYLATHLQVWIHHLSMLTSSLHKQQISTLPVSLPLPACTTILRAHPGVRAACSSH